MILLVKVFFVVTHIYFYFLFYSASKYAVYGFTEALSEELMKLGKNGVKTTTVCPAFVSTGLVKQIRDK